MSRHVVSCYITSLCRVAVCHVTSRRVPMCHAVLSPAKQAEDIKIVTTVPSKEAAAAVDQPTTYTTKGKLEYFTPCIQVSGAASTRVRGNTDFTVSTCETPTLLHRKRKWFRRSTNFTVSTSGTPNLLHRKYKWNTKLASP